MKSYSVEGIEGGEEHIYANEQDLPKVKEEFPVEGVLIEADIQEAISV